MRELPETEAEFRGQYWLKEELVAAAKTLGITPRGGKLDVMEAIAALHYRGAEIAPAPKPAVRVPAPKLPHGRTLALDAHIVTPYANDEEHRAFFLGVIGAHFTFNVRFMNWMKENQGKSTYREAVAVWNSILEDKKAGHKTEIGSQFEYNQYTRDFFVANPGRTRKDCLTCWNFKKSEIGSHRYEESDLEALTSRDSGRGGQ